MPEAGLEDWAQAGLQAIGGEGKVGAIERGVQAALAG